jgi:TolB-like protein/Tfp pilus assembly protein PilF
VLAEFASVVDAVESAVEIQKVLEAKNAELPENRRMEFRIGINLGDVVEEGERIYGDGVNIAARIEGLAERGGICISRKAFQEVKNKLSLGYEYLGEHSVKNIAEPVRVYRLLMDPEAAGKVIGEERPRPKQWRWAAISAVVVLIVVAGALAIWNFYLRRPPIEPASLDRMAYPLPDDPSIAVLPFKNLSGDLEQEYLADGITENIITALSKTPKMFVIASNSVFTYKGKPVKVQKVAEEMGVRYVLEGSLQKSGDRLRINAQLIDAIKGHHLWAERYDQDMSDIFVLQDEIAKKIITALQVKLTEGEQARLWAKGTENLEAHQKFLQGFEHYRQHNPDDLILAWQFFEEAIALDPKYADPFIFMGQIRLDEVRQGLSKSPQESVNQAFELAQKALSLDELHPDAYNLLGWGYLTKRQYENGIAACERAVAINPNHAHSLFFLGIALSVSNRPHEAIPYFERALRLNPLDPAPALIGLGDTYRVMGRYEEAIPRLNKALVHKPKHFTVLLNLAACYSELGREEEANAVVEQILKLNPKFSLERFAKRMLHRGAVKKRYLAALRKAGLPKTPPLPLPDKPSIAVLPFVNMSGDPEQEYFSDGITEEIITALSKVPDLFVIARNSSFTYKGKSVWIPTVGRELGVRYVLEGSVRKAGDKVRITAQLIDAKTNHHLWAERYDRELKDVFAVQDEITMKIITAMQVELTEGEAARIRHRTTDNLKAWGYAIKGFSLFERNTKEDNAEARKLFKRAVNLDPNYAWAWTMLAWTHFKDATHGFSQNMVESFEQCVPLAQKALALDDSEPGIHVLWGLIYLLGPSPERRYEKAISQVEKAISLAPTAADSYFYLGWTLLFAGRSEEALSVIKKAMRLHPYYPPRYLAKLGEAYMATGHYEKALVIFKQLLERSLKGEYNAIHAHLNLAGIYIELGLEAEARAHAAEVLKLDPNFSILQIINLVHFKEPARLDQLLQDVRKAGLK